MTFCTALTNGSIETFYELLENNSKILIQGLPIPKNSLQSPEAFAEKYGISTSKKLPRNKPHFNNTEHDILTNINTIIKYLTDKEKKFLINNDDQIKTKFNFDSKIIDSIAIKISPKCKSSINFIRGALADIISIDDFTSEKPSKFRMQTLLSDEILSAKINKIYTEEMSLQREKGTSFLYLVLGFLTWKENHNSDNELKSPLFAMPIKLAREKENGSFIFHVEKGAEEVTVNLSLKERLKQDFNIEIPNIDTGESPVDYYKRIETVLKKFIDNDGWYISSEIVLTILDFSKLVMYRDLAPEMWEPNNKLSQHPVIKSLIGQQEIKEGYFSGEQFNHSELTTKEKLSLAKELKLVESADISQIEVILNILNSNQSYIIKGPPGTGKSQTITNLIALALYNGKKVLFVSEKLAALEVVKKKLDNVGLGDFCLELHSDKTQKSEVIKQLSDALYSQNKLVKNKEKELYEHYSYCENKIDNYVSQLHSNWKDTEFTIYHIFNKTAEYRLKCPENYEIVKLSSDVTQNYNRGKEFDINLAIENFLNALNETEKRFDNQLLIDSHPWRGVGHTNNIPSIHESIYSSLNTWQNQLKKTYNEIQTKNEYHLDDTKEELDKVSLLLLKISTYYQSINIEILNKITNDNQFERRLKYVLNYFDDCKSILNNLTSDNIISDEFSYLLKISNINDINKHHIKLSDFENFENFSMEELNHLSEELNSCNAVLCKYDNIINKLSSKYNIDLFKNSRFKFGSIKIILSVIESSLRLSEDVICYRDDFRKLSKSQYHHLFLKVENFKKISLLVSQIIKTDKILRKDKFKEYYEIYSTGIWPFKVFKKSYRNAISILKQLSISNNINNVVDNYDNIFSYYEAIEDLQNDSILMNIFNDSTYLIRNIDKIINVFELWEHWQSDLKDKFGTVLSETSACKDFLNIVNDEEFEALQHFANVNELRKSNYTLTEIRNKYHVFFDNSSTNDKDFGEGSKLSIEIAAIDNLIKKFSFIFNSDKIPFSVFKTKIEQLERLLKLLNLMNSNREWFKINLTDTNSWNGDYTNIPGLDSLLKTFKFKDDIVNNYPKLLKVFCNCKSVNDLEKPINDLRIIVNDYNLANDMAEQFFQQINSSKERWFTENNCYLNYQISRNDEALRNKDLLSDFVILMSSIYKLEQFGLKEYALAVCDNRIKKSEMKNMVFFAIYNALSIEICNKYQDFSSFSGSQIDTLRNEYRKLDIQLIECRRNTVKNKLISLRQNIINNKELLIRTGSKKSDLFEISLINNEGQKRTKHIPLRQLFKRAPITSIGLKPCFMMSPLAVANYIEPGVINFDLLIMDEASQVRPSDALGAIARANQFVVVGDEKQMPPSNFFERNFESDKEDDEKDIIEEDESILDAAISAGFPSNMLKWHYRSRHESLIYFSNKYFYDNQLIVFPSPKAKTTEFGIIFEYIDDAYYSNGVNESEAIRVVDAIIEHAEKHPSESLAVVAMNEKQSSRINELFNNKIFSSKRGEDAWNILSNHNEPLLIKNLETIQGDERDVVFISCTYGKDYNAQIVYQRFGPINTSGGERRLNVLFSRAKKRMHVFSSMQPDDVKPSERSKGVNLFRYFLSFAKTGIDKPKPINSGKSPDSDFEIAVAAILKLHGYDCIPQVGVQGYFIDIGVVDPRHPDEYLMGIECDGATYHSSAFARDRDCLRQQILENLGWRIRRIWSTDWFKNPKATIKPIIDELKKLSSS